VWKAVEPPEAVAMLRPSWRPFLAMLFSLFPGTVAAVVDEGILEEIP
jgi:hypothetical protein